MLNYIIIGLTVLFSYQGFKDRSFFYKYDFSPYQIVHRKEKYRFITHALLHADWQHLFFNMIVLWMFGKIVLPEFIKYSGSIGYLHYVLLYVGGIVFATIPSYRKEKDNINYHSIGASGAVSAVLFSYIMYLPVEKLTLIIFPFFGLPSVVWGIIYLAYEHYKSDRGNDHINHDAHFAGGIFGIVFTILVNPTVVIKFFNQIQQYISQII